MKKKMSGSTIFLIIIISVFIYIFVDTYGEDAYIKNNGIEVTAKVTVCQLEYIKYAKGYINMWCSSGYYYVNGKKYRHRIEGRVLPIGTEFRIKYDPRKPNVSRLVNPHEFDNYPRKKECVE